jgi:hypothetical protein
MTTSKDNMLSGAKAQLAKIELASRTMEYFVPYINTNYDTQWFHRYIMQRLDAFLASDKPERMMIWLPPQTGKSELSTRMFIPYAIGRHPDLKIAMVTYGDDLSRGFNRDIKGNMTSKEYGDIFPDILLGSKAGQMAALENSVTRIDIATKFGSSFKKRGFIKTTAVKSPLTGTPVDILVMDDVFKDMEDAQSSVTREQRWNWFFSVANSRFHNKSKVIFLMTRWHEDDLAGRLITNQPDKWDVIRLPALKDNFHADYDNRKVGEALWENRQSAERMLEIKRLNPLTFNALYQQDPKPPENLLIFSDWSEMNEWRPTGSTFYSIDWGFMNDPTALVQIWVDRNKIYLKELIYESGVTNEELLKRFRRLGIRKDALIICDHNEPKTVKWFREEHGYRMAKARKNGAAASIKPGIRKLKEFEVLFSRDSPNIRYERNNYVYQMSGGQITDDPAKGHDHAMDAIRQGIYTVVGTRRGQTGRRGVRSLS